MRQDVCVAVFIHEFQILLGKSLQDPLPHIQRIFPVHLISAVKVRTQPLARIADRQAAETETVILVYETLRIAGSLARGNHPERIPVDGGLHGSGPVLGQLHNLTVEEACGIAGRNQIVEESVAVNIGEGRVGVE